MLEEADDAFKHIFLQATELSGEAIPRRAARQSNRSNYTTNESEVFHGQSFYLLYLDGLILQLTERLSVHMQKTMKLQLLVLSHIHAATFDELLPIIDMYYDDLGSSSTIKDEFERWQMK